MRFEKHFRCLKNILKITLFSSIWRHQMVTQTYFDYSINSMIGLFFIAIEFTGHEPVVEALIANGAILDVEDNIANKKALDYALHGRNYTKFTHYTYFSVIVTN